MRSPAGDLGTTLAVKRQVEAAELHPDGAVPSSVLIVRRVEDPLPGRIGSRRRGPEPDPVWEHALRQRLANLYRSAARPALGSVPENAEAVLFTSRAELLACLAADMASGCHWRRWWWQGPLSRLNPATRDSLAGLLLQEARLVPALLGHLDECGRAQPVLSSLDAPQALAVLEAVVREHGLSPAVLNAVQGAHKQSDAAREPDNAARLAGERPPQTRANLLDSATSRPWSAAIERRQAAALPLPNRGLLAVALSLHAQPRQARSPLFAIELERWLLEVALATTNSETTATTDTHHLAGKTPLPQSQPLAQAAPPPRPATSDGMRAEQPPSAFGYPEPAANLVTPAKHRAGAAGSGSEADSLPEPSAALPCGEPSIRAPQQNCTEAKPPSASAWQRTDDVLTAGVETRLGGVFYLVNLLDALVSANRGEASWALVELVARALIYDHRVDFAGDPVWRVLALLDGRDPDTPAGLGPESLLWLDAAIAHISARLRRLLAPGDPGRSIADELLIRRATVYVTSTHVDVVMPLEEVSIPVRRAGLDQDPGWQPALGRIIFFHFR